MSWSSSAPHLHLISALLQLRSCEEQKLQVWFCVGGPQLVLWQDHHQNYAKALNSAPAILQTNSGGASDRTSSSIEKFTTLGSLGKGAFPGLVDGRHNCLLTSYDPSSMGGSSLSDCMTAWAGGSSACNWLRSTASSIQIKPRPTAWLFKRTTKDSLLPGRILLFPVGFGSGRFGSSRKDSVLPGRFRFLVRLRIVSTPLTA